MKFRFSTAAAIAALALGLGTQVQAASVLNFIVDGDTFTQPYSITNASTAGEMVVRFQLDLAGSGLVFDPVTGGPPGNGSAGTPFAAVGGTGVLTGLQPVSIIDGATLLDLHFTDFNAGETFSWDIDVDPANTSASATVFGNQMIGASAIVDYNNGVRLIGILAAVPGNADAAAFSVREVTTTPPAAPTPAAFSGGLVLLTGLLGARRRRHTA
jgi:hypothetical protein